MNAIGKFTNFRWRKRGRKKSQKTLLFLIINFKIVVPVIPIRQTVPNPVGATQKKGNRHKLHAAVLSVFPDACCNQ